MRSSNAALSSRSAPGCRPPSPYVVSRKGFDRDFCRRLDSLSRRASSIRAVTVVWDSAESFLTSANRSSGMRTVVLMHKNIS